MQGKDPKLPPGTVGCLWLAGVLREEVHDTWKMSCRVVEPRGKPLTARASAKMSCFPANLKVQGVSGRDPLGRPGRLGCMLAGWHVVKIMTSGLPPSSEGAL